MSLMSIGVVAQQAGVATSTIRYYERIRLLPLPKRVSGKRQYDNSILKKIWVIRVAQQAGFTIAEIQTMVHGFSANTPPATRWQTLAEEKIVELDEAIVHIQGMKLMLESALHEQCAAIQDCPVEKYQATGVFDSGSAFLSPNEHE